MSRRGGSLTPLDKLLSHNDALAQGWNSLLGAVRQRLSIPGDIRELIILRVAVLNGAAYEWAAHLDVGVRAGLDEAVIQVLQDPGMPTTGQEIYDVVLRYTEEMTCHVAVSDETFARVQQHFSEAEIVELTAIVASYNMVSRFLVAMDVAPSDREAGPTHEA
jgi:4-carboxymuconolactone decarboxylase